MEQWDALPCRVMYVYREWRLVHRYVFVIRQIYNNTVVMQPKNLFEIRNATHLHT